MALNRVTALAFVVDMIFGDYKDVLLEAVADGEHEGVTVEDVELGFEFLAEILRQVGVPVPEVS